MSNYSHGAGLRIARHYSGSRGYVRRDSPPSTTNSAWQVVATSAPGPSTNSDDDDDLQPPPQLSDLGRSVLEQHDDGVAVAVSTSTQRRSTQSVITAAEHHLPQHRSTRSRAAPPPPPTSQQQHAPAASSSSRSESPASKTPARATTTPAAPSQRVKRVGLQGAPVRRMKRTPQSEDENNPAAPAVAALSMADSGLDADEPHEFEGEAAYEMVDTPADDAARDQENVPVRDEGLIALKSKVDHYSAAKAAHGAARNAAVRPAPLAPVSANTPHRPAPPPPPKMSVLEAATKAVGPSATRKKSRRANVVLNGKTYTQMGRCGKGGSAEVFRVQAENGEMYALKKVRLAGADPAAIAGYKGEIDLLRRLQDTPRVIRLLDYMVDEEKLCLYVVSRRN
jgi:serine/threonine-protein kinase TTK/MPS1